MMGIFTIYMFLSHVKCLLKQPWVIDPSHRGADPCQEKTLKRRPLDVGDVGPAPRRR